MALKKIAYQGEPGSFSEVAAEQLLKGNKRLVPLDSLEQVFAAIHHARADYAVVPIENSLVGSIHKTYDLLLDHKLHIIGETQLRVVHCLIAPKGTAFSRITKAFSHPVALEQCRNFFAKHTSIAPVSYYDTAGAVKMLAESGLPSAAAVAGPHAADTYGMSILRKSIEDEKSNHTRFILLSRKPVTVRKQAKTSLVFSMKNMPGALFKALSVFALRDIDLTRIESRPVRVKAWQYYFYVDLAGSVTEKRVKRALEHLGEITHFIRILGSYSRQV